MKKNKAKNTTSGTDILIAKICKLKACYVSERGELIQEGDFVCYKLVKPLRVCGHRLSYQTCLGQQTYFDQAHGNKDEEYVDKIALLSDYIDKIWASSFIDDSTNLSINDLKILEEGINCGGDSFFL